MHWDFSTPSGRFRKVDSDFYKDLHRAMVREASVLEAKLVHDKRVRPLRLRSLQSHNKYRICRTVGPELVPICWKVTSDSLAAASAFTPDNT